jgi:hypothetical protein
MHWAQMLLLKELKPKVNFGFFSHLSVIVRRDTSLASQWLPQMYPTL